MTLFPTPAVIVAAKQGGEDSVASTSGLCKETCSSASSNSVKGSLQNTAGALPASADTLTKPARALLMRLLEKDPKVRLRNLRQLQQSAFYLGFNFEHIKGKKVSPRNVLENHISNISLKLSNDLKEINTDEFSNFDQEL